MPLLLLLSTSCSRNPDQADEQPLPVVDLPVLHVEGPVRGAFFESDGVVLVQGTVRAGTHPLSRLTVNEQDVSWDEDGWFSVEVTPVPGVNLLGVRLEDEGGERAVDGRSFHFAGDNAPGATLQDAVWMRLGPSLLDDGDGHPDDLAAIAERFASDPSLAEGFIGTRIPEDAYEVEITGIDWADAAVDLVPNDGVLWADVTLYDVRLDFDVFGVGWYDWISTSGYATADEVLVQTDLVPVGGTDIEVAEVYAVINGFTLEIEWVPFEELLADSARQSMEEQLKSSIGELAGDLVSSYLDAYAITVEPFEGVELSMDLSQVSVSSTGLVLQMDAGVRALSGASLPPAAGSLRSKGALDWAPDQPFAVAMDDDLVNQLLFAMWATGGLGFEFDGDALGALTGQPLPPPLGPVQTATLSLGLPPVLRPAEDEEHDLALSLGEFVVDLLRTDGERVTASINAAAGGWLEQQDAELAISLDDRPKAVEVEVGMIAWPGALDPGDLASLLRLTTPTLLGSAGAFTPAIPLPGVPLDLLGSHPDLDGRELYIDDADVELQPSGWLALQGGVVVR